MVTAPVLALSDVTAGYGPIPAIRSVSLEVHEREVVALLGANGAGKTTTIRAITGIVRPWSGAVRLDGEPIQGRSSAEIAARGVAVVPEGRQVFAELTVDENLRIGAYRIRDRATIERTRDEVLELFPVLRQRLTQRAGTLSGGEQQMLAVGRALMLRPRLMLLDEPAMGLAPLIVEHVYEALARIVRSGVTALLVEQNAPMALTLATRAYVLVSGSIAHAASAEELARSSLVLDAYLGAHRPDAPPTA
jgi:branched-chain amino acid transport system ATP-binding protein